MSDDTTHVVSQDATAQTPETPKEQPISTPAETSDDKWNVTGIVRGGTLPSSFEKKLAEAKADAERRRAQDDQDRKLASVPIEEGGGKMFSANFADKMSPKVLLKYVGRGNDTLFEILCDVTEDPHTNQLTLTFVCPECFLRKIPMGECQCSVRDGHRAWHIDRRELGQPGCAKNDANGDGLEHWIKAGRIMDTDILRCSHFGCGCGYRIDNNVMRRV